jgi:hypothetical protein
MSPKIAETQALGRPERCWCKLLGLTPLIGAIKWVDGRVRRPVAAQAAECQYFLFIATESTEKHEKILMGVGFFRVFPWRYCPSSD